MRATLSALVLGASLLGCGKPPSDAPRQAEHYPVLPPGQERVFVTMLGARDRLAGRCLLEGSSIRVRTVSASYRCDGVAEAVVIELHYPATAPAGSIPTARFAVYPRTPASLCPGLLEALVARVRAHEMSVRWSDASQRPSSSRTPSEADPARAEPSASLRPPLPLPVPPRALSGTTRERHLQVNRLILSGDSTNALIASVMLAREAPEAATIAPLAASIAAAWPSPALAAHYATLAEAAPDDAFGPVLAGLSAAEAAHRGAASRAQQRELYERAERWLTQGIARWPDSARLWISLGTTRLRLGRPIEAGTCLARAEALDAGDPELALARAELLQSSDPAGARAAIDAYVAAVTAMTSPGAPGAPGAGRQLAQGRMLRAAMARSNQVDFDPLASAVDQAPLREWRAAGASGQISARALCLAACILGFGLLARARREPPVAR